MLYPYGHFKTPRLLECCLGHREDLASAMISLTKIITVLYSFRYYKAITLLSKVITLLYALGHYESIWLNLY